MNSDAEELLLGKDILSDLGINVDDMLAQFAHGADFVDDSDDFGVGDESLEPRTVDDLEHLIAHASDNGMDAEHLENLREVLNQYPDIWQDSLNSGPPARVEPLRIQLQEGATPLRCKQRKYAPLQRQFIRENVALLAKNGLVKENRAARWDSAVVPVRKPGSKSESRLTIDYRAVNQATVPIAGTMSNTAAIMDHVTGAVALAKFDMKNGFCCLVRTCVISGQGIHHDPSRVSALTELPLPSTSAELQYFICASNWLRDSIVDYARVVAPLLEKFDAEKKRVGRRNRNALNVAIAWTDAERSAFAAAIAAIKHSVLMKFPTEDDDLCMFCDASMNGYSIELNMVQAWDPTRPGFRLYCDHANLIYLFSLSMDVKQHVHDRLQRWSLRLLGLPQTPTAVADLSRLRPLSDANFVFPSQSDIVEAQKVAANAVSLLPVVEEERMLVVDHKLWISTGAKDLLAQIMVVAHCGAQGHRGEAATESLLGERFFIVQLHKKVSQFIKACLIRKHVKGPRQIQRPYDPTFPATVRNEALHWDFIYLGEMALPTPIVQANMNHTPMSSLADHSPGELFTGLQSPSALDVVVRPTLHGEELVIVDLTDVEPQLAQLRASLEGLHKEVGDIKEKKRLADMQRKTGAVCNFDVGDYVLWSRIDQRLPNNKLLGQWLDLFRIIEALPHAFNIQHLRTNKVYEVHGTGLKYYADADLNMIVEMQELVTSQGIVLDVKAFIEHRYNEALRRWGLLVQ
ncbi:unnamed protein product [Phytophthora fragariaefolia]|uniref:Unnamed protein product n=1 Tax=Phytophthora fragariaefolia TaxID=1490495 RepID=A0A9W6XWK8_9STRA|nr:unnamed protein product [Phytophthora fragariaefolia]